MTFHIQKVRGLNNADVTVFCKKNVVDLEEFYLKLLKS